MDLDPSRRSALPPQWVSLDGKLIILARGLRTFVQGSVSVILAIYLDMLGFSVIQIGALITAGFGGASVSAFVVGLFANTLGRRRLLVTFSVMTATAGVALVTIESFPALASIAFLCSFSGAGGAGAGPVQALEQASLPEAAPPEKHTDLFAIYNIIATSAMAGGALAAGLPQVFHDNLGISQIAAFKAMFLVFAAFNLLAGLCFALLSPAVEVSVSGQRWSNPLKLPSRRLIFTLSGLFSVDHFAGGLIIQSLVSLWFFTRFGVELRSIALVFFGSHVLSAVSLWVAAKLANRIGLINTMVFTHIPANLLLIAVPLVPVAWMAVALWLARSALGMMDVPTRQSYTMAVVGPEERVAMASINTVSRSITVTASPSVATLLWSAASAAVPFVATGVLKIGYDVALYAMFRNVKTPEEERRKERSSEKNRREAGA
jgi:MFS family permease